jgi:hypothetical protein
MELYVLEVAQIRVCSRRWENGVVLAPHDERRRLVRAEILLPLGVARWVAAITVEQLQLSARGDFYLSRPEPAVPDRQSDA